MRLIFAYVMRTNVMCIGIVDIFYLFHKIANVIFLSLINQGLYG